MKNLSIKYKVWAGYLAIITLMLINATISINALNTTRTTMNSLVEDVQPLVLKLHDFNAQLGKSSTALGTYLFTQASESLVKINETVHGMLEMNRQIATAAESPNMTNDQVHDNISSIRDLSKQTSASANTIASTSKQVNALSVQLQQLLPQFKV